MENLQAQRCRARLDHLESADAENLSEWNNVRVKRILVDYMLRMSYYDTAVKLAESSNIHVLFLVLRGYSRRCIYIILIWRTPSQPTFLCLTLYCEFVIQIKCTIEECCIRNMVNLDLENNFIDYISFSAVQ